jgi:hypothetical protein
MRPLSLRAIESESWKTMHQNGLFDLFFGVVLSANALSMLLDELGVAAAIRIGAMLALYAVGIVGSWLLRRRCVVPRAGTAKFGTERRRRIRWTRIVLAISMLLTLALLALITIARFSPTRWLGALGDYGPSAFIGIIILIPLGMISYAFDSPRMLIHGTLFVGAEFATVALGHSCSLPAPGAIAFGSAAGVSLTIGLVVFTRFLRTVPRAQRLPAEATADDR